MNENPRPAVVHLHARHAQVGEQAVAPVEPAGGEDGREAGEVGVVQFEVRGDGGELLAGRRQVGGVEVDGDQLARRADPAEQFGRVAGEPEGAIDDDLARLRVQGGEHLVQQDGPVGPGRRAAAKPAAAVHDATLTPSIVPALGAATIE